MLFVHLSVLWLIFVFLIFYSCNTLLQTECRGKKKKVHLHSLKFDLVEMLCVLLKLHADNC